MDNNEIILEETIITETEQSAPHDLSTYTPEKVRKPGEIGFALIGTIFGILGYYFAMGMTSDSYSAPSVFPKVASIIIISCGLVTLVKAIKRERPPVGSPTVFEYLLPKDVVFIICMLFAYCLALPRLHFVPSSYAFMVIGMIYLHRGKQIIKSFIYSALSLAVLVVIFRYVFLVILP